MKVSPGNPGVAGGAAPVPVLGTDLERVDESTLVRRVAQGRDQQAFLELFRRHEATCYNLAFCMLGSRHDAEEALQETMLQVWRRAETFDPQGNLAGWIHRILSNKCIRLIRARRRHAACASNRFATGEPVQGRTATELTPVGDAAGELRELLSRLAPVERHMIMLRFCFDFSQEEIGQVLKMPQNTISKRLQVILARLRRELNRDALAGATGGGSVEALLREVAREGGAVPTGLDRALLARLAEPGSRPAWSGSFGKVPGGNGLRVAALAIALACALAFFGGAAVDWTGAGGPARRPAAVSPAAQLDRALVLPERGSGNAESLGRSERGRRRWRWDFEKGEPSDIHVLEGAWRFAPSGEGGRRGCMETGSPTFLGEFRIAGPRLPLRARLEAMPLPVSIGKPGPTVRGSVACLGWFKADSATFKNIGKEYLMGEPRLVQITVYLSEDFLDSWTEGQRSGCSYHKRREDSKLTLWFRGRHRITTLELEEIGPGQVPDLSPQRAALSRIPVERRIGDVVVPELTSLRPPHPVFIRFSDPEAAARRAPAARIERESAR